MLNQDGDGVRFRVQRQKKFLIFQLRHCPFPHALVSPQLTACLFQIMFSDFHRVLLGSSQLAADLSCCVPLRPQPPPPGVSMRMRSPFLKRVVNFPGMDWIERSRWTMLADPVAPSPPPASPHGPRVRRSESKVT